MNLVLENYLTINKEVMESPNLCGKFSPSDLDKIGIEVWEGYDRDQTSRMDWERRTGAAMDLALQMAKNKNFPWPNCANVAFPLITIATLQFHARAYPAIISGTEVVKCRIIGEDPDGAKRARADRISTHMSYQVLEEDSSWEEQHDRLLINLAVVGTAYIKTRYDSAVGYSKSDLVPARNLVVNYWAKSIEECPRKTHIIPLYRNEVRERVLRGVFRDVLDEEWYITEVPAPETQSDIRSDERQGVRPAGPDSTTPLIALEQHCNLDLDNDGYAEPYIITIDSVSMKVLRIVTRFDRDEDIDRVQTGKRKGSIISIRSIEYFTCYTFIPSPDGSHYGIGFGVLTGPLNESVNSLINQLIDAGSMANGGGGFLGRGAKIRGGAYTFAPFEWKRVDSSGDDLHKSIVPLQVREPSNVLLQLLSLLIDYTNRITGTTDTMVGESVGQNTPAETSRSMVEQGSKIYSAIFKRIWRSMREEFKKRYILNAVYMPAKQIFGQGGSFAMREDYIGDPSAVVPAADPNIVSESQRYQQALAMKQAAMTTAGYDHVQVEHRYLKALHVDGIEQIFPGPEKTGPLPNPKVQVEQMKIEQKKLELKASTMIEIQRMQSEVKLTDAKVLELQAKAALELEQAGGVQSGHQIAAFEAAIGAMKVHSEHLTKMSKLMLEGIQNEREGNESGGAGMAGMGSASHNAPLPGSIGDMAGETSGST